MCVSKRHTTRWGHCPESSAELARELVIDELTCSLSHECTSSRTCSTQYGSSKFSGPEIVLAPRKLAGCVRANCWNWPGAGLWPTYGASTGGDDAADGCTPGVRAYLRCCQQRPRLTCAPLILCTPAAAADDSEPSEALTSAADSAAGSAIDAATDSAVADAAAGAALHDGSVARSGAHKAVRTSSSSGSGSSGNNNRKARAAKAVIRRAVSRLLSATGGATSYSSGSSSSSTTTTTSSGSSSGGSSNAAAAACKVQGGVGAFLRTNLSTDPVWRAGLGLLPPLGAALQAAPAVAAWYAQRWDAAFRPLLAAVLCGAGAGDPALLPPDAALRASAAVRLLLAPPLGRFLFATPTGAFLADQLAASWGVSLDASTINTYLQPGHMATYAAAVQAFIQSDPLAIASGVAGGLMGGGDDDEDFPGSGGGDSGNSGSGSGFDFDFNFGGDGDGGDANHGSSSGSSGGDGSDGSADGSDGGGGGGSADDDAHVAAFWAGVRGSGAGAGGDAAGAGGGDGASDAAGGGGDGDGGSGGGAGDHQDGDDDDDDDMDDLDDILKALGLADDDDDEDAGSAGSSGSSGSGSSAAANSGGGGGYDDGKQRFGSGGMVPLLSNLVSVLTAGGPLGSSIGGLDLGAPDLFSVATDTVPGMLMGGVAEGLAREMAAPDTRLTAAMVVSDVMGLGAGLLRAALNASAAAGVRDAPDFARSLMAMSAGERAAFTAMANSLDALTAAVVDLMAAADSYPAPPPPRAVPLALPAPPAATPMPVPTRMPPLPPPLAAAAGTCASPAAALTSDLLVSLTSPLSSSPLFGVLTAAVAPAAGGALRALPAVLGWWAARWDASMQPVLAIAVCSPPGTPVPLPAAERALAFLRWLGLPLLRRALATNTGAVMADMAAGPGFNASALDAHLTRAQLRAAVGSIQRAAVDGGLGSLPAGTIPLVALLGALLLPPSLGAADPRFTSSDMTLDAMVTLQAMAELPLRAAAAGWVAPQPAAPRQTGAVSPGAGAAAAAASRYPFYDSLLTLTPSQAAAFKAFSTSMAAMQASVVKMMAVSSGGRPGPLLLSALPRAAFPLGPAPLVTAAAAAATAGGHDGEDDDDDDEGLSGGAIAGIVIGVLAAVVIAAAVAFHIRKKQQQRKYNQLKLGGLDAAAGAAAGGAGAGAGGKLGSAGASQEFDYESGFGRALGRKAVPTEDDDERAALAPGDKSSGLYGGGGAWAGVGVGGVGPPSHHCHDTAADAGGGGGGDGGGC
ncbi:hypothetical protein HXX76_013582 [Chlamydomonas incerta]|uniref:Uncharacterized protein n=1 Tax=Chlamydomonas incerta TaxID=51695 RepID=A0A835SL78_CHLIN|nr:hypothetical protein HXX76_013582 [Chlamydomonas incerta]|eukprot:KAG2425538.1 hypothetical protein HXX76_013582 [Chlamydomonas incerta]